jgi:TRAP-type C4-dicarboxylate transport system substrate-binding protein
MRIARRTFLASAAAMLAAPAVLRLARADAPQAVLKLHHFMSSVSSAHDKFIVPWARKVQADSGGRIRIDIFPSMQLGGAPPRLFDQARDGDADIVWTAPSLTPGRFPKIEMFDLPFVPSRRALVSSKALQDFAALNLKDEFHEVRPLCFSCTDRGVIHANQPIRTVEDIKDLKIHVPTQRAGEALHLLGAEPVPMPTGQLVLAVNQNVIEGCLDPWHIMPALRLNDILKTHTEFSDTSPSSTTFVLAMNSAAYDRLPRDLKAVIDSNSGQVAAGMAGAMWDIEAASVADGVARGGDAIVTLLPEAVAHWRKLTEPVVEKWVKEMKEQKVDGGKLLASAHTFMTKYASEPEPQPPQPPPQQDMAQQNSAQQNSAQQNSAQQNSAQQQAVAQPPQQALSPQPQAIPQQPPQASLHASPQPAPNVAAKMTPHTNPPPPATAAPSTTASTPSAAAPTAKPVPPQPPQPPTPAPRIAAPSSVPTRVPGAVAKPVPPSALPPKVATPAPAFAPAPPATASVAKPAAAPAFAPAPPAAAPAPSVATIAPATKPAAAPVLVPAPAPVPTLAPKPMPKSLDIPL